MTVLPTFADVEAAAQRIAPHVHRTPIMTSATLDGQLGAQLFFKCENLQKVGAFKARGATNAVFSLSDEECARGVIAHSSGNHGAAVAYAASRRGAQCVVVMQEGVKQIKIDAIRGYGAEVVLCAPGQRETTCDVIRQDTGMTFIHPYEDPRVIAGQGTAAKELLEDVPDLDAVITPVGGGGLCSGTAITCREKLPDAQVFAAEPFAVDDAFRSLRDGTRYPAVEKPQTLCDGLLTGLGENTYAVLSTHEVEVVCVDEGAIVDACKFLLERMKLVVEPSGATPLAGLRALGHRIRGQRIGLILTGGNTDLDFLR